MKIHMRGPKGMREVAVHEPVEIGPEIAERMGLEIAPGAASVGSFVMTRGAQRAWEAINGQLNETHGALLWIGGASGTGKTHFLNYVVALNRNAGSLSPEPARNPTLAIEIAGRARAADIDSLMLQLLARELAGDQHKASPLWRQMRGAEAIPMALEQARRQGVRTVTVVIDFSAADARPAAASLRALAEAASTLKHPKLTVIAAGRGDAPEQARAFKVAPETDEVIAVAIGRARRLDETAQRIVEDAYRGTDSGEYDLRAIYPFHPAALAALGAASGPAAGVAPLARLAREALVAWHESKSRTRLIYPADLMESDPVRIGVEARLGENGRAALKLGFAATGAVDQRERAAARQMVDTLMLHELGAGAQPLDLGELLARMPPVADSARGGSQELAEVVAELAAQSDGVIEFNPGSRSVRFNPRAAGAPEVAAFNAALPLVRRFDSTLTPAGELAELRGRLKRLGDAMASALEGADHNREMLGAAMREAGAGLSADQQKIFAGFIAIAEAGPQQLIECAVKGEKRESAISAIGAYEALALVAAAVPRLRSMREYLAETGLLAAFDDDPARDRHLVALETECQLLMVAVNPATLSSVSRNLDSLEARFQKFKWTYVQHYRSAHEAWRLEMERLTGTAEDACRHVDALRRLNSIAALGAPEGIELEAQIAALERRVVRCDLEGPLSPEITPCCPRCGLVIGTPSPRAELEDLLARAKRALQAKLAILSQSAIGRLIENHDHNRRLEGFLKITQAAQTEALIRILDDKLTRYLARLLDENVAAARDAKALGRGMVHTFRRPRFKRQGGTRGERALKAPPADDSER